MVVESISPYAWLRDRWGSLIFRRNTRRLAGRKLLRAFADAYPRASFIEIGSNDGGESDPLRPFILSRAWRGIMIEPLPHLFERLRANYDDLERVAVENCAIAVADGRMPFFYVGPLDGEGRDDMPDWYETVGSFSRETVLRHAAWIPDLERRIVRTEVPCLSFDSVCRKHGVERLDLVLIDAEGYDWEIVKRIDLGAYRPRLLIYEHFLLSADDRSACRARVEAAGYSTMEEGYDTWCLDERIEDSVTKRWRRLRPASRGVSLDEYAPIEHGGEENGHVA